MTTKLQRAGLAALLTLALYGLGACGGSALTPEEERLHIAQTVDALPPAILGPTQTAIMATIIQGIKP